MPNVNLIRQLALQRGLDPNAVLAVASAEGLSGGIGDQGHAFGPWQLNNAGGVITGKFSGQSPQEINRWAWSRPGLEFALNQIAGVARGLSGREAVTNIVRRFERPAAPGAEVQRALAALPQFSKNGGGEQPRKPGPNLPGALPSTPISTRPAQSSNTAILDALVQGLVGRENINTLLPRALAASPQPQLGTTPVNPKFGTLPFRRGTPLPVRPLPTAPGGIPRGAIAELLHEGVGGATHSTGEHIHAAFNNPQATLRAISLAQQLGLSVRENPYVDPVDPVHSAHSYHYRRFPGLFHGKPLGEAIDVNGPRMMDYYRQLAALR